MRPPALRVLICLVVRGVLVDVPLAPYCCLSPPPISFPFVLVLAQHALPLVQVLRPLTRPLPRKLPRQRPAARCPFTASQLWARGGRWCWCRSAMVPPWWRQCLFVSVTTSTLSPATSRIAEGYVCVVLCDALCGCACACAAVAVAVVVRLLLFFSLSLGAAFP